MSDCTVNCASHSQPLFCLFKPSKIIQTMDPADAGNSPNPRIRFDIRSYKYFPKKLYDVANDGVLVKWNSNGTSVLLEKHAFEQLVMDLYPGFVKIGKFLNFRRLFREYKFSWRRVEGSSRVYEFSHPAFVRGKPELLGGVRSKRIRRLQRVQQRGDEDSPPPKRRFRCPPGRKRKDSETETESCCSTDFLSTSNVDCELSLPAKTPPKHTLRYSPQSSLLPAHASRHFRSKQIAGVADTSEGTYTSTYVMRTLEDRAKGCTHNKMTQRDRLSLLAIFAKNELNDEECMRLLANTVTRESSQYCLAQSQSKRPAGSYPYFSVEPASNFHLDRSLPMDRHSLARSGVVHASSGPSWRSASSQVSDRNGVQDNANFAPQLFSHDGLCQKAGSETTTSGFNSATETTTSGFNSATDSDSLSEDTGTPATLTDPSLFLQNANILLQQKSPVPQASLPQAIQLPTDISQVCHLPQKNSVQLSQLRKQHLPQNPRVVRLVNVEFKSTQQKQDKYQTMTLNKSAKNGSMLPVKLIMTIKQTSDTKAA